MIQAAIFDLDGTLLDTPTAIVATITTVLSEMGYGKSAQSEHLRSLIGLPLEQSFSSSMNLAPDHADVQLAVKRYRAVFNEQVIPHARTLLFPGVEAGLATLQEHGIRLAVATSKIYQSASALLAAADLAPCFDLILGSDQVKQPKPHPEMLHVILARWGLAPTVAVMVGDTTHDIIMGRAAGLTAIGVTYGVHAPAALSSVSPHYLANTFEELVTYCLSSRQLTASL